MRDYNRFINSVLENPLLRSSEIIEEFITKNQNDFHVIKLKYKKLEKKVLMKEFQNLSGELDATFYQEKYNLSLNIPKIIEKKRNLYLNLHNALKELINEFEIIENKMHNLSEAFFDLSNEYKNNFENIELLENLGNLCKNMSNIYSRDKKFFKIDVKEFFKYIRLELDEVDKLFNKYKYAKINFEGCETNLKTYKNNKLNGNDELYKFELQRKQLEKQNAKRICCFLQNNACDEYKRVIETHKNRIKKTFGRLGKNIVENYQQEYDNLIKLINSFGN